MIYIGIDPGVRACGVAIEYGPREPHFARARLQAFLVRGGWPEMVDQLLERFGSEATIVQACVEGQQFYGTERSKGDPNDLIGVAHVGGLLMGALMANARVSRAMLPLPRQWKGTLQKHIHHQRLRQRHPQWIEPVERDTPKSMQHHVWDAVGLLEWMKGRSQ
jgi:hypothetical protein